MSANKPHFLLYSKAAQEKRRAGEWSFVLASRDGRSTLAARDAEPDARGERLELLAMLRGLEALDQPSTVTVLTNSRYVRQGLMFGLDAWRRQEWQWESFGELVPVRDRDLWQRVDRARRVHQVEVRRVRFDLAHGVDDRPQVIRRRFDPPQSSPNSDQPPASAESMQNKTWPRPFWKGFLAWFRGGKSLSPPPETPPSWAAPSFR